MKNHGNTVTPDGTNCIFTDRMETNKNEESGRTMKPYLARAEKEAADTIEKARFQVESTRAI